MFGFDISKVAIVGAVALVVLGPERLPRVARMAGTLLGRAQRYMYDVRTEVEQQIRLDELRQLKADIEHGAAGVQDALDQAVRQHGAGLQAGLDDITSGLQDGLQDGLPATYLPSVHEAGSATLTDIFSIRPPAAQVSTSAEAGMGHRRHSAVGAPARTRWPVAVARGRASIRKRHRVVSVAASKSLGRGLFIQAIPDSGR